MMIYYYFDIQWNWNIIQNDEFFFDSIMKMTCDAAAADNVDIGGNTVVEAESLLDEKVLQS